MKLKGFSRTFLWKFEGLVYQKSSVILYINLQDLLLGKKQASLFVFMHCYIKGINVKLWQIAHFDYFLQLKVKSLPIPDCNPNSRTFQRLEFFLPINSKTFQDFEGPWQPCIRSLTLVCIICNARGQSQTTQKSIITCEIFFIQQNLEHCWSPKLFRAPLFFVTRSFWTLTSLNITCSVDPSSPF